MDQNSTDIELGPAGGGGNPHMAEHVQFQAFHLCVAFVCLATIRVTSRAALSTRFRKWVSLNLPWWASDLILCLTQWWVILAIILTVELILTKSSILAVMDATLSVRRDMEWLATLSRWACPACLLTYALCVVSIAAQVRAAWRDANSGRCGWHRDLRWVLQYPRDVALQVLFMPMVYHLMMCRSLLRRWAVFSDGIGDPINEHQNLMAAGGDASLAEMYDAYALWCFGNLGMGVADRELRRQTGLGQSSVFTVLQGTLMFGVKAYVVTAVLGALYSIGLAFVVINADSSLCSVPGSLSEGLNSTRLLSQNGGEGGDSGVCTFTQIIYGADFATSTIAIYNLFSFEHQLSHPLEKFNPAWKFWSMKIPVTLSFSELMLLKLTQPLTGLTTFEMEILDTMAKAYFMILVSLLNIIAWKPSEEWYYWEELCEDSEVTVVCSAATSSDEETPTESEQQDEEEVEAGCCPSLEAEEEQMQRPADQTEQTEPSKGEAHTVEGLSSKRSSRSVVRLEKTK